MATLQCLGLFKQSGCVQPQRLSGLFVGNGARDSKRPISLPAQGLAWRLCHHSKAYQTEPVAGA